MKKEINNEKKKEDLIHIFQNTNIRTRWDSEKEDYWFSVVDVIKALTESKNPRHYWAVLKSRLKEEGSELVTDCDQLKMRSSDGKFYNTDVLDTKGILRLIQSVPSPKAEPFKMWLAQVGSERIDETFDPSKAIDRSIMLYRSQGMDDSWIEKRIKGRLHRFQLTDVWKENGINDSLEYGILTNEIYYAWSGMKANQYKEFKGLRKESLRDNMSDLEILLTDIGETATKELAKKYNPDGLEANKIIARQGGVIANNTRKDLENALGEKIVNKNNNLKVKYLENNKN